MQKWIDFGSSLVNVDNICDITFIEEYTFRQVSINATCANGDVVPCKISVNGINDESFNEVIKAEKDKISAFLLSDEKLLSLKR